MATNLIIDTRDLDDLNACIKTMLELGPVSVQLKSSRLAEVIVRLNREGYTGTIYSEFSGGKFSDMDQDEGVRLAGEIDHWLNPAKPEKHQGRIKDGF